MDNNGDVEMVRCHKQKIRNENDKLVQIFYVFIINYQLLGILSSMQFNAIHDCFPQET